MASFITPIAEDVTRGNKSAAAYVDEALARAEASAEYNALISLTAERARQRAKEIDARIAAGETVGPLAGVPFIAKDNFLSFGGKTTAASAMLKDFEAPYQATAIERLEAAGAICIGKANLDAFAHGGSTENSHFGPTLNPVDKQRVPGGSSGGSAAAVALDIVPFALGTDTGGSIRLPASYCGVVGLKPTYGRVSRYGVVAMASSTDTVGPLTRTVEDAALVLDIIAGQDARDATTLPSAGSTEKYADACLQTDTPKRIGVIKECMGDQLEPGLRRQIEAQLEAFRAAGHTVEEVSLPSVELALAVYYIVVPAEISSNLARYDGIRFGYRSPDATNLQQTYEQTRSSGFNDENVRRIMIGNYVLSSGYYDAYYRRAQTVRTKIIKELEAAYEQYDVLVSPVATGPAYKFGEKADPLAVYLVDVMTVAPSLAGLPAISVPCGTDEGLPVGLQIIGAYGDEPSVLRLAASMEAA
ncbi:Asp-tRNA(Asn)/Glu-tRNA(Gln) amidotransferase subunit GatA [Candidatus Saccharibacteria bacterium]|nr:Asp-tRNA(Asn)/Glu-tRNA(Gln) amidotransferase subunit GatA [Candidatus Saccharibacteria bacterium]